ncbi:MAG: hypothetical protein A2Z02_03105 [Chloroflexi bacterium RBG_16_48_7]|nr:MAG: hypothetical protein A2Z02_03105 [Chloroflexi bacterium RBG_16_48_7]
MTILYEPYSLTLPKVGSTLALGDFFGTIEGYKMMADLPSPVSGVVIGVNDFLVRQGKQGQGGYISSINTDPYNSGWMFVVQLSKPDELKVLMTAQSYRDLVVPQEEAKSLE